MTSLIDDAARMPLPDAAFALWRARRQLDAIDGAATSKRRSSARPGASASFMASVQDAIQAARDEPTHAHEGPTFHRLKSAHPEASDANIQDAIKAAVKLEADCARYFSHSSPDHESNVDNAVRLARIDNPGFSDVIYKSLFDYMAFVMK